MNNNTDNFNINLQPNNMNNHQSRFFNNPVQQPTNVIPQNDPVNIQTNTNQNINQTINVIPTNNNQNNTLQSQNNLNNNLNQSITNINNINNIQEQAANNVTEEMPQMMQQNNKFITNNIETNNTALNDLNIDGTYHNMPKVDYSQEPKVIENINQAKKNTITITSEGKVFIIIIIVLLLFIVVMPTIFDFIQSIKYQ